MLLELIYVIMEQVGPHMLQSLLVVVRALECSVLFLITAAAVGIASCCVLQ